MSGSRPSLVARLSVGLAFLAAGVVVVFGTAGVLELPGDPVEFAAPLFAAGCAGAASLYLRSGNPSRALAAAVCAVGTFLAFSGATTLSLAGTGLLLLGAGGFLVSRWRNRIRHSP